MTQLPAEGDVEGTVHSNGFTAPASPPPVPVVALPELLVDVVVTLPELLAVDVPIDPPVPELEFDEVVVVVSELPPSPEPELELELDVITVPLLLVVTAVVLVPLVLLPQPAHTAIVSAAVVPANHRLLLFMMMSPELSGFEFRSKGLAPSSRRL